MDSYILTDTLVPLPPNALKTLKEEANKMAILFLKKKKHFKKSVVVSYDDYFLKHMLNNINDKIVLHGRNHKSRQALGEFSSVRPKNITLYFPTILEEIFEDDLDHYKYVHIKEHKEIIEEKFFKAINIIVEHEFLHCVQNLSKNKLGVALNDFSSEDYYDAFEFYPLLNDEIRFFEEELFKFDNISTWICESVFFNSLFKFNKKYWKKAVKILYKNVI